MQRAFSTESFPVLSQEFKINFPSKCELVNSPEKLLDHLPSASFCRSSGCSSLLFVGDGGWPSLNIKNYKLHILFGNGFIVTDITMCDTTTVCFISALHSVLNAYLSVIKINYCIISYEIYNTYVSFSLDWTFSDFHRTEVKEAHTEITYCFTSSLSLQKQ